MFSGGGGLTEGFLRHSNFDIVAHIEKDSDACLTLKTRISYHYLKNNNKTAIYKDYLRGNISRDELYSYVPKNLINSVINDEISKESFARISNQVDKLKRNKKIDIVFGGPPCQAYSLVGRARDKESMIRDTRKYLYIEYIRYLKKYKPRYFIFENVKGLLSSKDEHGILIIERMEKDFLEAGYKFKYKVLNAKHFGVIQSRERVIIIGYQEHIDFEYPKFENIKLKFTINDLFHDLPKMASASSILKYKEPICKVPYIRDQDDMLIQNESRKHIERDLRIYKIAVKELSNNRRLNYNDLPSSLKTHKNRKSFTDRYKVIDGNSYSHTIVAHIAKDGHYYIHPDIKQNRSVTVREAARIQSFPDSYYFEKSRTSAYRQIGNAVPPLMAEAISKKILDLF